MALNLTTFRTDLDAVSDLLEAETADADDYAVAVAAVKASDTTLVQLFRCQALLTALARDCGHGQYHQVDELANA